MIEFVRDMMWGLAGLLAAPFMFLRWFGEKFQEWKDWHFGTPYMKWFGHRIGETRNGFELVHVENDILNGRIVMQWEDVEHGRTQT